MYKKPVHYTQEELLAFKIEDLETDIRCVERDANGRPEFLEYAEDCRQQLAILRKSSK